MYSEFVKEFKIQDKNEEENDLELIQTIKMVENNLMNMHNNMEYVTDDLIDYYTYQIKAEEAKYNHLVKQAKERGLTMK